MRDNQSKEPSRILILLLLFVVCGPPCLGMLWKSKHFGPSEKKWLTVAVIVYTLIIIVAFVVAVKLILTFLGTGLTV